jgi:Tfp pilus assembly protein PilF
VDPEFGNPYNDIGVYLIELDRPDEAVPWLEQAITAPRYDARHFPHVNLGRIYERKNDPLAAVREYGRALEQLPGYEPALAGLRRMQQKVN